MYISSVEVSWCIILHCLYMKSYHTQNILTYSFTDCISLISFSCLMGIAQTLNYYIGQPWGELTFCLFPVFSENALPFSLGYHWL